MNVLTIVNDEKNKIKKQMNRMKMNEEINDELSVSMNFDTLCKKTPTSSDTCGDECNFKYNHNEGILEITGSDMTEYTTEEEVPWYLQRENIKKVIINEVTQISSNIFNGMINPEIEYKGTKEPKCSEEIFNECKIGYIIVPLEYEGETFCGQQMKSIGKCGENEEECQWTYYHQEKMLKIEGKGDMESYSEENIFKFSYAISAIFALAHDAAIIFVIFSLLKLFNNSAGLLKPLNSPKSAGPIKI